MYRCTNCGCRFFEPYTVVERHGLEGSRGEVWDGCPHCHIAGMLVSEDAGSSY